MRAFKELDIWKTGMDLAVETYRLLKQFPREEEYGLKSQLRRAVVSIPSNIAEGSSRTSQKEFKHFLEVSLGSSFEVESDLILAQRLEMMSLENLNRFVPLLQTEQKQINALISKINRDITKS